MSERKKYNFSKKVIIKFKKVRLAIKSKEIKIIKKVIFDKYCKKDKIKKIKNQ